MQNYPNSPLPPGGYGMPPQPPQKKGLSKGLKIFIVLALVFVIGGGALLILGGVGFYVLTRRAQEAAGTAGSPLSGLTTSPADDGDEAEGPSPTAEQSAAIAGGQSAEWAQQEISWTVPQKWRQHSADSSSLLWRSPGSWDAASLIANIAPMGSDFPTEVSLNSYYDSFKRDKQKYSDVRWLKLGGIKGVMFRESSPESPDSPQRLQWIGYRDYKGQTQYVTIMLASRGKDFARHEDALYGILYSTEFSR
ncbi:MAG TPA: hypothetical protein VD968_04305 [Pyrinomonadaceae bacterium]|nr:hypothetical protein [Pyrinomonadaceae bacterium]